MVEILPNPLDSGAGQVARRGEAVKFPGPDSFDGLKVVILIQVDSGADLAGELPGLLGLEIDGPEGPGSALAGANRIDPAAFACRGASKEYAVLIRFILENTVANPHATEALFFERVRCHV